MSRKAIIVGAGHNGLVAACYLAKAGCQVEVLEAGDRPGGGARTDERLPGYRFDMHSVAHNIINMTSIPRELDLKGAGLSYHQMDPFMVAVRADGKRVRFYRSLEKTLESIAGYDPEEAETYAQFMRLAMPLVKLVMPAIRGDTNPFKAYPPLIPELIKALRLEGGPLNLARDLLSPYESLLKRRLKSDLTRGPVSAYAAHGSLGPNVPGAAFFTFWQAAFHLYGQWHAIGGSEALVKALVCRLETLGGKVRCQAPVARIEHRAGQVRAVVLENGERLETAAVITAMHPRTALLDLLEPPLTGKIVKEVAALRTSNVVQGLVHVAVDRLPPYPDIRPEDYLGMQSFVDNLDEMTQGFIQAEAGYLPDPLPLYAFTNSSSDPSLTDTPGHHTVYLACPSTPARLKKGGLAGWDGPLKEVFLEQSLAGLEARAPGFRDTIRGAAAFTPLEMEKLSRWPLGHPMYLDLSLDQLGLFRPTRSLANHRTPVAGLYLSGAGTAPVGGIAGTPGKKAAMALLKDWKII
ncbi:MAG: Beta-carotene ketolase [Chloroflexi bacterium]|nr:Beta-carotene ketolase [Chloroflexota bacterium]